MSSKLRRQCLLVFAYVVIGLSTSLFSLFANFRPIAGALATTTPKTTVVSSKSVNTKSATELEAQGKYFYALNQFEQALDSWQQAAQIYGQAKDSLGQGRVMSDLALAFSQLNNWSQSTQYIAASLDLLTQDSPITSLEHIRSLAQVFNNQGIIELNQGKSEQAIATWEKAKVNYEESGNEQGIIRASINQASAFKQLGFYHRAVKTLTQVEKRLAQQPDSLLKAAGLRSYGDILRLVGQIKQSRQVLEKSLTVASAINTPQEQVKTLLVLGKAYKSNDAPQALTFYQRALDTCEQASNCKNTDLLLQIRLAQINLLSETKSWQAIKKLIPLIQAEFKDLPDDRDNIDRKINFAHNLVKLRQASSASPLEVKKVKNIPQWSEIDQLLENTLQQAIILDYNQAESYIWGLRGQIKEESQDWSKAQKLTQKALILAQNLNAPEIIYLWQWQLGRISRASGDRPQAIAHYSEAVEVLKSLSQDLVAIDPDVQYSFSSSVEPVYRGLVSLLLEAGSKDEISQANLESGRKVIESLQLAELNNFFREACLDAQPVSIEQLDPQAAVIYPIILSDRLEVILSLPNQPLKHYVADISQKELEKTIEQFRRSIVVRSRRDFYLPAEQLYNLLLRPALKDLTSSQVKTLVFVPDGAFRNIPLGALYNGKRFLVEDYSIALTPGLQLLDSLPLEQIELKTIAVGLTAKKEDFSALAHVKSELEAIKNTVDSIVLLNNNFTTNTLQQEIEFSDYPIVHIATHGQFSSTLEDTFLLAWDDRININQLDSILQSRSPGQQNAIELLVLSACETASGDKQAALGMAGMAVRAGARSTLATLWSVNDRATAKLMGNFYHELAESKLSKAESVRQAQLSLLHNSWYQHPFYWAPYVLLGNWL